MFDQYFKLPLRYIRHAVSVTTNDYKMALTWASSLPEESKERLIAQINNPTQDNWNSTKEFSYDGHCHVLFKGHRLMVVRGFGMLTGAGGYGLSSKEASHIQDEFANFIVDQLNKFGKR